MDNAEFRKQAHKLVDWMADYMEGVERYPVRSQLRPGDVAAQLPDQAPAEGEDFDRIFADFEKIVMPGVTHWQHPSFFAYFPANSSPPSVLAEMLTASLAAQCMLWQTSPAATEMETKVLDWLRRMIGLPEGFHGVIQSTASEATLAALLIARERASGFRINEDGWAKTAEPMAVYVSEEAHSSVEKGAKIAGFGAEQVRKIPADENFAIKLDALDHAIAADLADGVKPACIVGVLGGTGTGACDDLKALGEIARKYDLYLHIDAAWAGTTLIAEEYRHLLDGVEMADSFVFNPHKWMLVNFDCSAHFVRDPEAMIRTFSILPEYLKSQNSSSRKKTDIIDYRDWGIPLGRRFRALKLWFVLRSYGVEGLKAMVRRHIALARAALERLEKEPDFEITSPLRFSLFSFRHKPAGLSEDQLDAHNAQLVEALNDSGRIYVTQNKTRGRYVIRFQVGQLNTAAEHVEAAIARIIETARGLAPR